MRSLNGGMDKPTNWPTLSKLPLNPPARKQNQVNVARLPELSAVFSRLESLYADEGMRILSWSPKALEGDATGSTFVAHGSTVLSTSGGIAADEMAFAYGLCERVAPRKILVIGNSYGISTLFFALANPEANVIAIDKFRTVGIAVTNTLLSAERGADTVPARAVKASTPDDLDEVVKQYLDGTVDMVFVDAVHENEVQSAEFRVLEPLLSPQGVVIFHDVVACSLTPSIGDLEREFPAYEFVVCRRTTTGVAVAFRDENEDVHNYLKFWAPDPKDVAELAELAQRDWNEQQQERDRGDEPTARLSFPPHPQL